MDKEQRKAYYKVYNQLPQVREWRRAYRRRPEVKEKAKEHATEDLVSILEVLGCSVCRFDRVKAFIHE